ncbi:MAG: bacteriocin family protein [Spirochaetales bacterium]|nr:bacteriocin family protein [Spirochaetales bacterium]
MDVLRRELAPISPEAWAAIDEMARDALTANLSARAFVDMTGPFGIDFASVSLGRLDKQKKSGKGAVEYGIHRVLPLVETRTEFTLNTWELDNIGRGARDTDFGALIEACRTIAQFEETAVYNGFLAAGIEGLHHQVQGSELSVELNMETIVDAVSEGLTRMLKEGVTGPAHLVVSPALWKYLARSAPGGTLRSTLERQIGGRVVYSETVHDALLVSARGGDTELTVGQDLAIGYLGHTATEISLFLTESFTFRVITPEAIVGFKLA